jgi:hypothetical protein
MVPDYYARLGVSPEADVAEIEAALHKHQPIWSMGTRNPKTRHTNQLYLDEVPALRRALLSSPETRAAYDAELAGAQVAERERKLDQLQRRVRLRAAKGGLGHTDRALLRDEAAKLGLNENVLDRLTRLIPGLTEAPAAVNGRAEEVEPPADVLDPSTRRQIRSALEHLGCRDLYDALGLFRDAPLSVIAARADEERQRWMRKAQVTAEKTAWLEVISHAQSHLTSPKGRARYDRTLALEAEETFDAVTAFALKGLHRLDLGTRAALIDEAASLGIGSERAERLLGRAGGKLGVALDYGPVPPRAIAAGNGGLPAQSQSGPGAPAVNGAYSTLRCRSCAGVTELSPVARRSGPARCRHCGASLKWDCPVCRRPHWVDEPRCACGFPLALREPLVHHFVAAQHAFRCHDMDSARMHLEQVQKYAPHHVGARNGMAKIRQQQTDIEYARMAWELALSGKRLVAASRALEAWRKLVDPSSPEVQAAWKEVIKGLRQAEELAARARRLERVDPPAARGFYRKSLDIAADLPEAVAGLRRCPPDAPAGLVVQPLGDRIRLSWTPPTPDGLGPLTFAVLRKRGGLPEHPADGTRIAEVSTCEFEDRRVKGGETVSYAVLGKRGEAESLAAVAAGPVLYLPDVQDVRVEPREGAVELSWIPPHGVFEVRVVRKRGAPPADPRDGDRIGSTLDQALDPDLSVDQVYHYGIYAIYRTPTGHRFPSPGVVVAAIPRSPVPPLSAPRLTLTPGGQVRLDWTEPSRGSVRILRSVRTLAHPVGAQLTANQAEELEGEWLASVGPDHALDADPPPSGYCYYTPLLALGGTLTVGHGTALSRLPDPTDLRATRLGGTGDDRLTGARIQLRWRWPREAAATRIVARQGSPPAGPADPAAIVSSVTRDEYDRLGSWVINLPRASILESSELELPLGPADSADLPPDRWHVRVYSVALADGAGASVVSAGLEPTATVAVPGPHPEVTISYLLKKPWLPGRRWSIELRTEPPGSVIPPLVLVANARAIPLSADDGAITARFPAAKDGASFPIPLSAIGAPGGVRVFPDPAADPGSSPPVRIRHPETGPTRA